MTSSDITLLVVAILLVLLAGCFACVDAALTMVSRARVEELFRANVRGAARLVGVVDDKPRHASLLLLLRVACELFAVVIVAVVLVSSLGADWATILVAGGVMTAVSYILVGVGPRTLGRQHPYAVALRTATATRLLAVLFGPLATLLILIGNAITPGKGFRDGPFSTEVELRELVDLAEASGVVEHGERNMIQSVFELGDTIVREVMVPRPDVVWIEGTKSVGQALALALRSGFSRIPVIGENVDDVVGVIYLKDLARRAQGESDPDRTTRVEEVMRPPSFVPESKPVDALLREMQARRIHMAIVVDEYGGTAGLVTIEDILEEIVGEIADEYDENERPPVEHLEDGSVRVVARLPVEDLGELFDVELTDDDDVETVGGLLARELGRVPIPGAQIEVRGLLLIAESAGGRRNRIDSVLVRRVVPTADALTESGRREPVSAERSGRDA
ncbi:MAG: HlyC/CorC family transporter [Geodermatophilaceae bacterium]|nr:HlyC/CorC family transporter [Geodermatophilaceae bacterium]